MGGREPIGAIRKYLAEIGRRGGLKSRRTLDWCAIPWADCCFIRSTSRSTRSEPFDLVAAKETWLAPLGAADAFIRSRSPDEIGCLYWWSERRAFVMPAPGEASSSNVTPHFGAPGGVLPRVYDVRTDLSTELRGEDYRSPSRIDC